MTFRESLSAHAGILDGPSGFFVFKLLIIFLHSYSYRMKTKFCEVWDRRNIKRFFFEKFELPNKIAQF